MVSWSVPILPYIEATQLYACFDFDSPACRFECGFDDSTYDHPGESFVGQRDTAGVNGNEYVARNTPSVFRCPSSDHSETTRLSQKHYAINGGVEGPERNWDGCGRSHLNSRPFQVNSFFPFSSITDGTSNTMMFMERLPYVRYTDRTIDSINPFTFVTHQGEGYVLYRRDGGVSINTPHPKAPFGRHTGGVNTTICDGSVQFVSETMAARPYMYFLHKSDGQTFTLP
jgi:hypothetical protein